MSANMSAGFYDVYKAVGNIPHPVWPEDMTFDDILKIDFNEQRSLIQEVSDDKGSLRNLVRERTQLEDNINRINKTIKRIKDWDTNNELDIKKIQDQLNKILEIDIDEQKNIFDELTSDKGILRNLVREQTQLEDIVNRETNSKNKRTLELSHLEDDKCPFCLQKMPQMSTVYIIRRIRLRACPFIVYIAVL